MDSKSPNYNPGSPPQVHFQKRSETAYIKESVTFKVSWSDTAIGGSEGRIKTYYFDWDGGTLFKDSLAGSNEKPFSFSKAFPTAGTRTVRVKAVDHNGRYSNVDSMKLIIRSSSPHVEVVTSPVSIEKGGIAVLTVKGTDTGGTIRYFLWSKDGTEFKDVMVGGTYYVRWSDTGQKMLFVKAVDDKFVESPVITVHIYVSEKVYSVIYDGNNNDSGTPPTDTGRYLPGQIVTTLANTGNLKKTGSSFIGWNTAANGSGTGYRSGETFAMGTSNLVLYAQWTSKPTYAIAYDGNGNTGGKVPVDSNNYLADEPVTAMGPGSLVKDGHKFIGWNTAADGSGKSYAANATFSMEAAKLTLYAQWTSKPTYTVTYDGNGNTGGKVPVDSNNYLAGATVTALSQGSLAKTGCTFTGWNTAADGKGSSYGAGTTFIKDSVSDTLFAQWSTISTYKVTYIGNGNTAGNPPTDTNKYTVNTTVTVLGKGTLEKSGSTFIGWNTVADGSGNPFTPDKTFFMGSADMVLYAQWTANPTYSVIYNGNGNTAGSAPVDANKYPSGANVIVLSKGDNLEKSGHTFIGWNKAGDGIGTGYKAGDTLKMGSADVNLYAQWSAKPTYTVSYSGNGSSGGTAPSDPNNYLAGATVTVLSPGSLVRSGYSFNGWNTVANGGGVGYQPGTTFIIGTSGVALYAQWLLIATYSVNYSGNGNTGGNPPSDNNRYTQNALVTVLGNTGNLAKSGYSFAGWNTAPDGSGTHRNAGENFAMGPSSVTLYAEWRFIPTYGVSYNGNGNTGGNPPSDSRRYTQNALVTVLGNTGNLVKTGFTFKDWNTAPNGSGISYNAGQTFTMGTSNVALFAQYQAIPTYTVSYNGNGSTGGSPPSDNNRYTAGASVTVLGNTGSLVKSGFTFTGWNTAPGGSGTTYQAGNTFLMGASNMALYAVWSANPTFTVTYNGNGNTGGSVPNDPKNYLPGETVTVLSQGSLVKSGYYFSSWNTAPDGSGRGYMSGTTFAMGTSAVVLYAQWSPYFTVTYNGNGSTGGSVPVDPNPYYSGATVTVKGAGSLVKAGHAFTNWNTDANGGGTSYAPGALFTMGASSVVLYAQWVPVYTVTYNGNGSTGGSVPVDPTSYLSGATVTVKAPGSLARAGYAFTNWNTAEDGSGTTYAAGGTFSMGTSNVALYAQWAPVYAVTYSGNGSTGGSVPVDPTGYLSGATVTVKAPGNLAKDGYAFTSWNTAANGSGKNYAPADTLIIGSSNVALHAQWSAVPYTVTYSGNGSTGGSAPSDPLTYTIGQTVTVLGANTLVKECYTFNGWNTKADGSGTAYAADATFAMGSANVNLHAQWTALPTYTVTYDGNGETGGFPPLDPNTYCAGQQVLMKDPGARGLVKAGYSFKDWNTSPEGNGLGASANRNFPMPAQNTTWYAQWTQP